jgi:hypothetical protein
MLGVTRFVLGLITICPQKERFKILYERKDTINYKNCTSYKKLIRKIYSQTWEGKNFTKKIIKLKYLLN